MVSRKINRPNGIDGKITVYRLVFCLSDIPILKTTTRHVSPEDACSDEMALKLPQGWLWNSYIKCYCLFKLQKLIFKSILHLCCFFKKGSPYPHLTELSEKRRIPVHSFCIVVFIASNYLFSSLFSCKNKQTW